jgi:hypothetical protein
VAQDYQLPWNIGLFNNGWHQNFTTQNEFFANADFESALSENCPDGDILEKVWIRHEKTVLQFDCSGTRMFATFSTQRMSREDSMESLDGLESLTGTETSYIASWFVQIQEKGCLVDLKKCGKKSSDTATLYSCPLNCPDVTTFPAFAETKEIKGITFEEFSSEVSSECLKKMMPENAQDLIDSSTMNSEVLLRDMCQIVKPYSSLEVAAYVDLFVGQQYLVKVSSGTNTCYAAMYKFAHEQTQPFIVAHPYQALDDGLVFLGRIRSFLRPAPE